MKTLLEFLYRPIFDKALAVDRWIRHLEQLYGPGVNLFHPLWEYSSPLAAQIKVGMYESSASDAGFGNWAAVSYTHLTLPTTPYV